MINKSMSSKRVLINITIPFIMSLFRLGHWSPKAKHTVCKLKRMAIKIQLPFARIDRPDPSDDILFSKLKIFFSSQFARYNYFFHLPFRPCFCSFSLIYYSLFRCFLRLFHPRSPPKSSERDRLYCRACCFFSFCGLFFWAGPTAHTLECKSKRERGTKQRGWQRGGRRP